MHDRLRDRVREQDERDAQPSAAVPSPHPEPAPATRYDVGKTTERPAGLEQDHQRTDITG
ncbi:MAG TPA: hypothetical protein VFP72_21230 [Kineosporiaceae bacterium]|nr:hypothetical protein [Kineosporiaceae bacterium]